MNINVLKQENDVEERSAALINDHCPSDLLKCRWSNILVECNWMIRSSFITCATGDQRFEGIVPSMFALT